MNTATQINHQDIKTPRIFHRVGNCFGLTLWTWRRRVELWVCFTAVEPHSHPGQAVEIVPLFGWADFYRRDAETQRIQICPRRWFHQFSIPAGCQHWFTLRRRPLIFLNVTRGRSAAENFEVK